METLITEKLPLLISPLGKQQHTDEEQNVVSWTYEYCGQRQSLKIINNEMLVIKYVLHCSVL